MPDKTDIDSVIIENRFCPMCGKRLEVEHEN